METENMGWLKDVEIQLRSWEKFYQEVFGFEESFSGIWVPEHQMGFGRLIAVAKDLTPEWIVKKLRDFAPVDKYLDNLDAVVSVRKTALNYVVRVRDSREADEDLQSLSPYDLLAKKINCITLEERLLLESKYLIETRRISPIGRHLDEQNATLCTGSIDPDGYTPVVRCYGNQSVDIDGTLPSIRADFLRGRQVIS